ncbi:LA2681 family HEPN domain-containing protein [Cobetia amphilecti]|uniref:LA2681 family HEPN domain-containing protein n=1 Tax=Cobetia amphilecti TaxID=1055104 RepID=UPI00244C60A9|nr:LA2681 family HEPN domain-containing protein [Cobetia litoralis]MDH2420593.1 LA2681 family HEPN domain-containing protein [Cobetia litoralis]
MEDKAKALLTKEKVEIFASEVDVLILAGERDELRVVCDDKTSLDYNFEDKLCEAHFWYVIGNIYSFLYSYSVSDWYSDDLSKSILFYRKSLYAIRGEELTLEILSLKSLVETNLANELSGQGRMICAIPLYQSAINFNNPVALISKARNDYFYAGSIYDDEHAVYHYREAAYNIRKAQGMIDDMHPEHREAIKAGSQLDNFANDFESRGFTLNENISSEEKLSNKEVRYIDWVANEGLFLNDLNDLVKNNLAKRDTLSLPSITSQINILLSRHESLAFHGNFDELKNDFCYARYIYFTGLCVPEESESFYNSTYHHVDDGSLSINNFKTSSYKASFRVFYSLFDKIAYFIHRFFDLAPIEKDRRVSFSTLFVTNDKNKIKPNKVLSASDNCFIHALFYILKDLKDVRNYTNLSKWVDPDTRDFDEIRNAMEHRSLKIVDDLFFEMSLPSDIFDEMHLRKYDKEIEETQSEINIIKEEVGRMDEGASKYSALNRLKEKKEELTERIKYREEIVNEKKKLSTQSLLVSVSDFESRLMKLATLCRNSLMYLAYAIYFEERKKPNDKFVIPHSVPLKK